MIDNIWSARWYWSISPKSESALRVPLHFVDRPGLEKNKKQTSIGSDISWLPNSAPLIRDTVIKRWPVWKWRQMRRGKWKNRWSFTFYSIGVISNQFRHNRPEIMIHIPIFSFNSYLSIYLSMLICLSIYLSINLSIDHHLFVSISLSMNIAISLSLFISIYLSIFAYISTSLCLLVSIYISNYSTQSLLSFFLSFFLSFLVFLYISTYLCPCISIYIGVEHSGKGIVGHRSHKSKSSSKEVSTLVADRVSKCKQTDAAAVAT